MFKPYYFAFKYQPTGKVFISHLNLPAGMSASDLRGIVDQLEAAYTFTKLVGGITYTYTARCVSVSESLLRTFARNKSLPTTTDMSGELPRLITGRAFWTDTGTTPPTTHTRPFIVKGVDPTNTTKPSSLTGTATTYQAILELFLKKYLLVAGSSPDAIEFVKNVKMN